MSLLETNRLLLTPFQEADFDYFYELQCSASVMRYVRPPEADRAVVRARLEPALQLGIEVTGLGVRIVRTKEGGRAIGHCILRPISCDPARDLEIGYLLEEAFWGRGYATEIVGALVRYALVEKKAPRVTAFIHPENQASRRVLEKNGFVFTGTEQEYGETYWLFVRD
jgi:ribosomal-protein-alanine N-acetyltransferase